MFISHLPGGVKGDLAECSNQGEKSLRARHEGWEGAKMSRDLKVIAGGEGAQLQRKKTRGAQEPKKKENGDT